jgi:hypothetical protein
MHAKTSQASNTNEDEVTNRRMEHSEELLKETAEKKVSKSQAKVTDT